ncbi:PREDICTED: mavicyanin-like [Nicotiana attenuata]|uniref:Blue copper protein n=1 Tax=Nicotiana attenuata TaxID=49451 RepID=A0A314KNA3_NICAT|nr:PREDICTED: mavicyanin-like [Nicotiana attenuata]OIT30773.1 blue copper protein [Nicotiana attenuata]
MASTAFLITLVVAVAMVTAPALSTDHWVGDDQGWVLNFDYKAWASTKEFHVGDTLIFKYKQGAHNVYRADQRAFQNCTTSSFITPLTSGNDVISLTTPGKKWYICGIGKHCAKGMKLAINVLPELGSPATAPSPSGLAS